MSWTAIALRDFQDARRSRLLWGVTSVFVLVIGLVLLTNSTAESGPTTATTTALSSLVGVGMFLVPLTVVAMAYLSITGERESGTIKYLLGLPTARYEVVLAKLVSRSAVALLAIAAAAGAGLAIIAVRFDSLPLAEYARFTLALLYFTLVYVGIVVGISALSATRGKALARSIGVYFVFSVAWIVFDPRDSVAYVVEDLLGREAMPELYDMVLHLSPSYAYSALNYGQVLEGLSRGGFVGDYGGELPFYLQDWFMIVVLFGWLVVPLFVGYLSFRRSEIP